MEVEDRSRFHDGFGDGRKFRYEKVRFENGGEKEEKDGGLMPEGKD